MMRIKKSIHVIGLFVLLPMIILPTVVSAQERKEIYTLDKSIKEALNNNWTVKAKKEKIDESMYVKKQAKADFFPKLSTSYGYTRLDNVTMNPETAFTPEYPLNTQDNYQWKTTVSQTLFAGFSLISAYELGKLGIDAATVGLELEKLDLVLKVKEAYFTILGADRVVEVARKEVESLASHLEVARSFYKVGMIPINDLLKAEVELASAQYNLVKAQNASKLARSAFNVVLSRSINEPVEIEDILFYKPETGDYEKYLNSALQNRPEIKAIDVNMLQADQQIRLAKSKFYPQASLNYDYIREGDHPEVNGSEFHDRGKWQVMAVLSWTFWEWNKTKNSVREKDSIRIQLLQTRSALADNIGLEIKKAILELEEADKNIPTTTKAVEQAEENLRVSQERYKAQVTTSTEVLDAQTLLTEARRNYYNALYDHNLAKARLLRAIGEY